MSDKSDIVDLEKAEQQIKALQIPYDYDTKEYPIEVLMFKFNSSAPEKSTIKIPPYQRNFIWKDPMKCRFIESLLLGVPIQPLFAAILDEDGTLELIDGSQRLRTIEAFVNDEFTLYGLKKINYLNGVKYSQLSTARKNKFGVIGVRIHVISDKADLSIRQDIFDRINTSGERANKSEIRKGAYEGKFYEFITDCSENQLFIKLCPISKDPKKRGEAEELILRFFTYSDIGTKSKLRNSRILDAYIVKQNESNQVGIDKSKKIDSFNKMLEFVDKYFPFGFARSKNASSTPRVRFEAISVGVHFALEEKSDLSPIYMDWLESEEFKNVTTSDSSGNAGKLDKRVSFVKDCLLNNIKQEELSYAEGER